MRITIQFLALFYAIVLLSACEDSVFGDFPVTYQYEGFERIDSQMYVFDNLFDPIVPLTISGTVKDSLQNKNIDLGSNSHFLEITFLERDSILLKYQNENERGKFYYYNGIDHLRLPNSSDMYENMFFDKDSKTLRQPLSITIKYRYNAIQGTGQFRYLVQNRSFKTFEDIAYFNQGKLFEMKNDSMGILFFDVVYRKR